MLDVEKYLIYIYIYIKYISNIYQMHIYIYIYIYIYDIYKDVSRNVFENVCLILSSILILIMEGGIV